jgi:hypothetical protein
MRPPLLVCERSGRWAAAVRRAFARRGSVDPPRVIETRSLPELCERIAERRRLGRPASPWIVELTPHDAEAACDFLARHVVHGADVPTTVVAAAEAAEYEATVRTAGANLFVSSLRRVDAVVDLYERYRADLSHRATAAVADDRSWFERTWDDLPWGNRAAD